MARNNKSYERQRVINLSSIYNHFMAYMGSVYLFRFDVKTNATEPLVQVQATLLARVGDEPDIE